MKWGQGQSDGSRLSGHVGTETTESLWSRFWLRMPMGGLARTMLSGALWCIASLGANPAKAQSCPFGYPVDCGSYCCESGGICYDGGCNAPPRDSCPAGSPVDCGSYCCSSGAVCADGGCRTNNGGDAACPAGYPVDCGSHCCENGSSCTAAGCAETTSSSGCPSGYPTDCGSFCCPSNSACGTGGVCLASSGAGGASTEACPSSYPVNCGDEYCCPSGTTCTATGCQGSSGSSVEGSDLFCASDALNTEYGTCNLDFCIADYGSSCESYYLVNGQRITCSACAADSDCVQRAASACSGSGVSSDNGPPGNPSSSGACCGSDNSCGWQDDGVCDCGGEFGWDYADCEEGCSVGSIGKHAGGGGGAALALTLLGLGLFQRRRARA